MIVKTKKLKRIRVGAASKAVLGVLAGVGVVATFAVLPGLAVVIAPFLKQKRPRPRLAAEASLASLIRGGFIVREVSSNGTERIRLTKKGRFEALLMQGTLTARTEKWDGEWRMVIFDVPNTKTKLRNELRRSMKLFGFKSIQKSVWVYPYSCDDFVSILKSHLGVSHDVLYITASYIENDRHLRQEFNL